VSALTLTQCDRPFEKSWLCLSFQLWSDYLLLSLLALEENIAGLKKWDAVQDDIQADRQQCCDPSGTFMWSQIKLMVQSGRKLQLFPPKFLLSPSLATPTEIKGTCENLILFEAPPPQTIRPL